MPNVYGTSGPTFGGVVKENCLTDSPLPTSYMYLVSYCHVNTEEKKNFRKTFLKLSNVFYLDEKLSYTKYKPRVL